MTDYTQPPTEEFRFLTQVYQKDPTLWLTLQKAVMNDYWLDTGYKQNYEEFWDYDTIDLFIHKIYYCWQEYLKLTCLDEEE